MKWIRLRWRRKLTENEIRELEALMQANLVPVSPRLEFTQQLRRDLLRIEMQEPFWARRNLVLLAAGAFGVVFLISVGVRTLGSLIIALGLWQHYTRQGMAQKHNENPRRAMV